MAGPLEVSGLGKIKTHLFVVVPSPFDLVLIDRDACDVCPTG